jgi:heme/copper-type cytochrome/quinol oxidase subunit 2
VSNHQSSYSEQTQAAAPEQHEAPIGFFAIGIVINLALVIAYFVWAFRQWKKTGPRDKS